MPKLMPIIVLPRGAGEKMRKELDVSKTALYDALKFSSHSDKAKMIRDKAITEYGGFQTKRPIQ